MYDEQINQLLAVDQRHGTRINDLTAKYDNVLNKKDVEDIIDNYRKDNNEYDIIKTLEKRNNNLIKNMIQLNNEKIEAYKKYEKKNSEILITGGTEIKGIENKTYFRY